MTGMRDFSPSNEVRAESAFIDTGVPEIEVKESYTLDDSGGLGEFHRPIVEEESSNRGPILGALAVALMVGAAGVAAYSMYGTNDAPADQTAAVEAKAPPPPAAEPAMTQPEAAAPSTDTAMSAPPAPPVAAPEPRTTQQRLAATPRVMTPPVAPTMTPAPAPVTAAPAPALAAPVEQASAVPEAVSPTPPASAVAGAPANQQSAAPEAETVTPAAPAEAAPAPAAPSPAPSVDQPQ